MARNTGQDVSLAALRRMPLRTEAGSQTARAMGLRLHSLTGRSRQLYGQPSLQPLPHSPRRLNKYAHFLLLPTPQPLP